MANTSATDVITSFQSMFCDNNVIAADLQYQWFLDALGEFELKVRGLGYNRVTQLFETELPQSVINSISFFMNVRHKARSLGKINLLQNIKTKDLTFDATGDAKRAALSEYQVAVARADEYAHNLKTHCFV